MSTIAQKIEGYNKLNSLTVEELKTLLPQLQKFVGKRISIATGFSKTFHVEHYKASTLRCYLTNSYGSLVLNIDVNIRIGECSCKYFKNWIYVGDIDKEGILSSVESFEDLCTKYELNEEFDINVIKSKVSIIEDLEKEIRDIKKSISKFI